MPKVYAISEVPPEIAAYAMARYSRSAASLQESLQELSYNQAEKFLNTFYFQYGHASIADLAHIAMAIEDISILAAMDIVDEPLWDGQERSTRYQSFDPPRYYTPADADASYHAAIGELFQRYRALFDVGLQAWQARYPQPGSLSSAQYHRILKARALDIARYALPLATLTSLGQVTSARALEQQLQRLLASTIPEVQTIAAEMKRAASERPPLTYRTLQSDEQASPVAPTLIKYATPDAFRIRYRQWATHLVRQGFDGCSASDQPVRLVWLGTVPPLDGLIANALYPHTHLAYQELLERLEGFSTQQKTAWLKDLLGQRGAHDDWLRELRMRPLAFELILDVGAFRDFNRHRRLEKLVQPLTPLLGYAHPFDPWTAIVDDRLWDEPMRAYYQKLAAVREPDRSYLLPLAQRRRVLLQMDFAQAAYVIELRSRSAGHFSYRAIANHMYRALANQFPAVAECIRITPFDQFNPFER